MSEYLKRKIDKYLFDWKANPERKPLIIKGARQVGKTKSIETFAAQNYESIVEINFAEDPVYKQIVENGYNLARKPSNNVSYFSSMSAMLFLAFRSELFITDPLQYHVPYS